MTPTPLAAKMVYDRIQEIALTEGMDAAYAFTLNNFDHSTTAFVLMQVINADLDQ